MELGKNLQIDVCKLGEKKKYIQGVTKKMYYIQLIQTQSHTFQVFDSLLT